MQETIAEGIAKSSRFGAIVYWIVCVNITFYDQPMLTVLFSLCIFSPLKSTEPILGQGIYKLTVFKDVFGKGDVV